jgi:hypothetical protein
MYMGCDVRVGGKNFDALKTYGDGVTKELWEIKTWNRWSSYSKFVQDCAVKRAMAEGLKEWGIANACGYKYQFLVTNTDLEMAIRAAFEKDGVLDFPILSTQSCGGTQ